MSIKDISEVVPFILANPQKCSFLIILCLILGFIIGRFIENNKSPTKKQLVESKEQLVNELSQARDEIQELKKQCDNTEKLQVNAKKRPSALLSLNELIDLTTTREGVAEIHALIEVKAKMSTDNK